MNFIRFRTPALYTVKRFADWSEEQQIVDQEAWRRVAHLRGEAADRELDRLRNHHRDELLAAGRAYENQHGTPIPSYVVILWILGFGVMGLFWSFVYVFIHQVIIDLAN